MRRGAWVVPAYLALTLWLTWPMARDFGRALPTVFDYSDAFIQCYILEWDWQALATRPLEIFDPPIFHPGPRALTYMDCLIGEAVLGAPVMAVTRNPAAAYNSLVVLGFVLSAWATYRLVRWLGVARGGAFLCGFLFSFSSYRLCNICDLNLLHTEFLPLGLWFALRLTRSGRERDLWAAAGTLAVQATFGWYYVFHLATIYAVVAVHAVWRGRLRWRASIAKRAGLAALACALAVAPVAYPYWQQRRSLPEFRRTLDQTSVWSADVLDYLRVNVFNRTRGHIGPLSGDLAYWPGLVTVALAGFGLVAWRRREPFARDAGVCASVGLTGFVLSLGPTLRVAGRNLPVWLPYAALFFVVPGFQGMRASGRYAVVALIGAVALAGVGYESWRRRLAHRPGIARAAFAVMLGVALVDGYSVPLPMLSYPHATPPAYVWLARQPESGAVLELPAPRLEKDERIVDAERQLYGLRHGRPRLDGVSGFVPPATRRLRLAVQDFPSPHAVDAAAAAGARYVIVHYGDFPAAEARERRAAAAASPALRQMASFADDVVYELRAGRSNPAATSVGQR
ncbi:MAG TPA: hypothetical protein VEY91_01850 [Candidatus Limnocylindria bacterium]|nr:hypothetical protein [Candidatus Limnocylindria bacterium]